MRRSSQRQESQYNHRTTSGEVINLSALMGGRQTLMTDTTQEGEGIYSDNWAIKKEGGK